MNTFLAKPVSGDSVYRRVISLIQDVRPFIKTASFIGPDRRGIDVGPPQGNEDRRYA